jgi:hypothetical protein
VNPLKPERTRYNNGVQNGVNPFPSSALSPPVNSSNAGEMQQNERARNNDTLFYELKKKGRKS